MVSTNLANGHTRNCCDIDVETEYIVAWVVIVGGGGVDFLPQVVHTQI